MSKLLIETQIFEGGFKKPLNEGFKPSSNGNPLVEGIMATVEVKNGNGRYYKRELWERELENFQKKIDQKSFMQCFTDYNRERQFSVKARKELCE